MKRLLFVISVLYFMPMVYGQNDVKFIVHPAKDTVILGDHVNLNFLLFGVKSDELEKNRESTLSDSVKNVFSDETLYAHFQTFIRVKPKVIGCNSFGPYTIQLFDRELVSNKVSVYGIKRKMESIKIIMPSKCKLEGEAEIKLTNHSLSDYSIKLKSTDIFQIMGLSSSTSVVNNKFTKNITLNVILKKAGSFKLDKSMFKDLPDNVTVETHMFEVH